MIKFEKDGKLKYPKHEDQVKILKEAGWKEVKPLPPEADKKEEKHKGKK